jgi:hypothetical protein
MHIASRIALAFTVTLWDSPRSRCTRLCRQRRLPRGSHAHHRAFACARGSVVSDPFTLRINRCAALQLLLARPSLLKQAPIKSVAGHAFQRFLPSNCSQSASPATTAQCQPAVTAQARSTAGVPGTPGYKIRKIAGGAAAATDGHSGEPAVGSTAASGAPAEVTVHAMRSESVSASVACATSVPVSIVDNGAASPAVPAGDNCWA